MASRCRRCCSPTWPVPADLLFERVRSKHYMAWATAASVLTWLQCVVGQSRADLARYEQMKPVYMLMYMDCFDNADGGNWGGGACSDSPMTGEVYELLLTMIEHFVMMGLLQTVNNAYRSKIWALPALALIGWHLYFWGKTAFSVIDGANAGVTAQVVFEVCFALCYLVCWAGVLVLLARVLFLESYMSRWRAGALQHTKAMFRGLGSKGKPQQFQLFAGRLHALITPGSLRPEDLPVTSMAAVDKQHSREWQRAEAEQAERAGLPMPARAQKALKSEPGSSFVPPRALPVVPPRKGRPDASPGSGGGGGVSDVEHGSQDAFDIFEVVVDTSDGQELGVAVDKKGGGALRVERVNVGPFKQWNSENKSRPVKKGDVIIQVNGFRSPPATLFEMCQQKGRLELQIRRPRSSPGFSLRRRRLQAEASHAMGPPEQGSSSEQEGAQPLAGEEGEQQAKRRRGWGGPRRGPRREPRPPTPSSPDRLPGIALAGIVLSVFAVLVALVLSLYQADRVASVVSETTTEVRSLASRAKALVETSRRLHEAEVHEVRQQATMLQADALLSQRHLLEVQETLRKMPMHFVQCDSFDEVAAQVQSMLDILGETPIARLENVVAAEPFEQSAALPAFWPDSSMERLLSATETTDERLLSAAETTDDPAGVDPGAVTTEEEFATTDGGETGTEGALEPVMDEMAPQEALKELLGYVVDVADQTDYVASSVFPAFVASSVVALLAALFLTWVTWQGLQFRRRELQCGSLRDTPLWKPLSYQPYKAPMFPFMMASSAVLTFATMCVLSFLIVEGIWIGAYFFGEPTLAWLLQHGFKAIVPFLVQYLLFERLAGILMTKRGFVVRWCSFAWYAMLMVPIHMVTAAGMAVLRWLMLLFIGVGYVARVDVTAFPDRLAHCDPGYYCSMAMLLLSHRHHNPVMYSFASIHMGEGDKGDGGQQGKSRAARDWDLAVTLARNPQLAQYRRTARKERDAAEAANMADPAEQAPDLEPIEEVAPVVEAPPSPFVEQQVENDEPAVKDVQSEGTPTRAKRGTKMGKRLSASQEPPANEELGRELTNAESVENWLQQGPPKPKRIWRRDRVLNQGP